MAANSTTMRAGLVAAVLVIAFSAGESAAWAKGPGGIRAGLKGEDAALGYLSLAYAAKNGDVTVVKAWLSRGVDVNGRGVDAKNGELSEQATMVEAPIALAAEMGHEEVVKLLLDAGAQPDKCCCSCVTALHQAIRNKHPAIVKLLLDSGASPLRLFDGKTTPLELAIQSGDPQVRQYVEARLKKNPRAASPKQAQ